MLLSSRQFSVSEVANTVSTHIGMGSISYEGGTAFRVWAKFASAVYVTGSFNNWSTTANPLVDEGNGYWSVDVPTAKEGDRYVIHSPFIKSESGELRTDPYCQHVLDNENGDGIN